MKKFYKIVPLLMIIIMLLSAFSIVLADDNPTNPSELKGTTTTSFNTAGKNIIGVIQAIGSITAVVVLVALGIKYMMGSVEEKAEYKKTLMPYVIGAVLIFAASNLASVIYSWAINFTI